MEIEVYGGAFGIRFSDYTEAVLSMLKILSLPENLHETSLTNPDTGRPENSQIVAYGRRLVVQC